MNKNNFPLFNICKIGLTYVGAVIGAGFASGQEIFQFFIRYGIIGIAGIGLAGILFILGAIIFLQLARSLGVRDYYQIFYKLMGRRIGLMVDIIYILLILGSISVMLAGSGTIFYETLGWSYTCGVLITLLVAVAIILNGVQGILIFNTFLIPLLTAVIVYTSVNGVGSNWLGLNLLKDSSIFVPWFVSAIMYVSFNVFMSLAILSIIGTKERKRDNLVWGGIFGGLILTGILLLMSLAMYCHYTEIKHVEMPMLVIANLSGSKVLHLIYTIGLWFAMITTAVAHMYSFVQRVRPMFKLSYYNSIMLSIIVVLPLTRFGFVRLVSFLYPIYGAVTLMVLAMMGWGWGRKRRKI